MADLGAIEEDVPFDDAAADALIRVCEAAAGVIEGQAGSRASWKSTALTEFRGHFSELFRSNAAVAAADALELADRLREVAGFTRRLKEEAAKEQQRRETAREWKREQEDRSLWDKGVDAVFGGDDPPVGPPAEEPSFPVSPPVNGTRQTPSPGSGGGGGGGTSSARPADLRAFANGSRGANQVLQSKPGSCRRAYGDFQARCRWGRLEASGVFTGFDKYLAANEEDVRWATLVADAFAAAGGEGAVSTVANSALLATLQAAGVDAARQDLVIDPPLAYGHPPTTGYANDPVNTATGNFLESEVDLAFPGAAAALALTRTYNSFDTATGAFGPGWSSWTEARLDHHDDAARMTLPDGRVVTFPRLGTGWDRATTENLWLEDTGSGFRVTTNDGGWWSFTTEGCLVERASRPGTAVRLVHAESRLVRLEHERGRAIDLAWDEAGERVVGASTSDGRHTTYTYDDRGRLTGATGPAGTRTYRWTDDDLLETVVDADGVLEAENTYDDQRRVTTQRSPHGRETRFVYLPGNVTVASDTDGTRSNTWLHDPRGRLIGIVDAHEHRQSTSYDAHGNAVLVTERDGATTVHEYDHRGRRTRTVTPTGADLTFGYDEHDRLVTVATESGAVTEYTYDGEERHPTTITDPEGGVTRLTWADGLLTRLSDPTGVELSFEHDDHGDLVATTDALGNTARLERDTTGRVRAAITPSGARTTFSYGTSGMLASRRDPDGAVWHYEHTTAGRLSAVTDPTGARTEIEHGPDGEAARTIDPLGRATSRHLDDLGNLTAVDLPDGTRWEFTHDALSRLTTTTDPTGARWQRDYDPTGTLTAITDPTGARLTLEVDRVAGRLSTGDGLAETGLDFDRLGRLVATRQPDGSTTLTRYDRCGRPVEYVDAAGATTTLRRDAAGRVVELTRPTGARTRYDYDACGRLAAVVDPTGGRTTFHYDPDGRVVREVLPNGDVAVTDHDAAGRVVRRHVPGRGTTRVEYDLAGRVVTCVDHRFGRRQFRYDAAGQLVEAVNGNGGVTRYDHDPNGRVVAITDPLGHTTRREYDALGRLVAETDPLGRTTRAGYDAAGRQTWQEDPTGTRITWSHDESGRVTGLFADGVELHRIERDLRARCVRITEGRTRHRLEWDARGQLVARERDGKGVRWEYDAAGHCTRRISSDGLATSYERDAAGRLVAVDHPLLGRAVLELDAAGQVVCVTAAGTTHRWRHQDGFVVGHEAGDAETTIRRDDLGRVVGIRSNDASTTYDYDECCQLIEARTGGSVTRWRYDAAGRLVAESVDGATTERSYDAAGQLTSARTDDRVLTHTYDLAGRRRRTERSDGTSRDYGWAPTGWLSEIVDHDGEREGHTSVHVDALGELARVDDAEVFWESAGPMPELVQVGDTPVVPAGPATGVGGQWSFPGWRTSRSGSDPWQVTAAAELPGGVVVGAAGELVIDGLEWLVARVYDPAERSFLSTDPLDAVAGVGWAGNPYAYAGNDPLHALDPQGLRPVTDAELAAYAAANNGALAAAGDWVSDNWEYLAGGAMVIAGGVMMATGVGGPAGLALVSAGADTIIQKATTGEVNWGQVAVAGAIGAVGGGAAAWATRASQGGTAALRTTMAVNAGVNAAGAEAGYLIKNRDNLTWQGALAAGAGGAFSGAIGGAAGPAGGTIASQLGQKSTGLLATSATGGINFAGGFGGSVVAQRVNGQPIDLSSAALSGTVNTAGGVASAKIAPPATGTSTLNSTSYFGPRTPSGVFNAGGPNTQSMWGQAGTGTLLGTTFDLASD